VGDRQRFRIEKVARMGGCLFAQQTQPLWRFSRLRFRSTWAPMFSDSLLLFWLNWRIHNFSITQDIVAAISCKGLFSCFTWNHRSNPDATMELHTLMYCSWADST
jgi:hypothetical protein